MLRILFDYASIVDFDNSKISAIHKNIFHRFSETIFKLCRVALGLVDLEKVQQKPEGISVESSRVQALKVIKNYQHLNSRPCYLFEWTLELKINVFLQHLIHQHNKNVQTGLPTGVS